jgi:ABC-type glycerol-3-phosphate transport system substrate-binding protein
MLWTDPNNTPDFAIGTAAMPSLGALPSRYVQGYVMSGGTQHPEAAWRWLAFLSKQSVAQPGVEQQPEQIPARRSVAEASGYWDRLDDEARAAVQAVLDRPHAVGVQSFDPHLYEPLNTAILAAAAGEETPAAALQKAQAAYQEALLQAQQTPTPVADDGPIVVATPPPLPVAAEGATTIIFHAGWDDGAMRKAVEQFNAEQQAVFVELTTRDAADNGPQSLAQVAAEADVFFWYGLPPADEPITATLDLQPMIDADPSFPRDDYPAGVLARFEREGVQHGLPYAVTLRTLVYNADAFRDAGIDPPSPRWTLSDFVAAAEQLSGGEGRERRYGFGENSTATLQFFLDAAGAKLTTGAGDALAPNFTDPALVAATQQYIEFARRSTPDEALTGYRPNSWSDSWQLRQDGKIAMWFAYGLNRWELAEGASFAVGVAAPPQIGAGDTNAFWGNALFISAETQNAQAAWQFVAWMSGRTDALQGGFPARTSLAESPAFAQQSHEGAAAVYAAYREVLQQRPESPVPGAIDWSRLDTFWFYRAVDRALKQPDALERELEAAQALTEQFMACVQGGETAAACARSVDPEYEGFAQSEG